MSLALPLGPLMIDVAGLTLTDVDRQRLCDPRVGGLILFARNYASPQQLAELTGEIHALRSPRLLIAIDHEGGRVQRCRDGFTRLPAMRRLGELWEKDAAEALAAAREIGFVLAAELRWVGVDLSFTPVLDLDWGRSGVVGDRAFHRDPAVVGALAGALIAGLRAAGMAACGKHFPGHGWAEADSHVALPVDPRSLAEILPDIEPYRRLPLDAVMPAHVVYSQVDASTSGFSKVWNDYLRNDVKFSGVIFSDDLSMRGASVVGDVTQRAQAAGAAGCDILLVCNAPDDVAALLADWQFTPDAARAARIARLLPASDAPRRDDPRYLAGVERARALCGD